MCCIKCGKVIPDGSMYCCHCGRKQINERKPTKRGNGTGSVYHIASGWVAEKTIGWRGNSKRITQKKYGLTSKKSALDALQAMDGQLKSKIKNPTWTDLYNKWVDAYEPRVAKSTLNCYKAANNHFMPIWDIPLAEIDIDDLQDCVDDCIRGKRTRENMRTMAGLLYKYAIPRHYATLNLASYIRVSGETNPPRDAFTAAETETIRKHIGITPYADYIYCHIYLGFRPAELLALTQDSYNSELHYFVGGSKTAAGKDRLVTVSPKIQPIIDALIKKNGNYVFGGVKGGHMSTSTYRTYFAAALDAMGLPSPPAKEDGTVRHMTPHCCRHTFATLAKDVDAPDKDKLSLIGHTDPKMLQHYQHSDIDALKRITDAI